MCVKWQVFPVFMLGKVAGWLKKMDVPPGHSGRFKWWPKKTDAKGITCKRLCVSFFKQALRHARQPEKVFAPCLKNYNKIFYNGY